MKNINEMSKRALTLLLAFIMVVTLVPLNLLVVAEDGIIGSMVRIVSDTLYMYREAGEYAVSHSKNELPETLIVLDVATVEYDSLTKTYYKLGTVDGSSHTILNTYCWTEDYNVEIISDEVLLTIDDMEVGVLYKATFKYDMIFPLARVPFFSTYDDYENGLLDDYAVELEILPATVTVTKVSDDDFGYVYVTDENEWPTDYSAYRYVDSNILCIVDGDGAEISVDDMEIGAAYSATWSLYDGSNSIAPIRKVEESESNNYIEYDGDVTLTDEFPTELIVERKYEGDDAVYVTNTNWPSWLEQYRYFDIYDPETDWGDVAVTGVYTPPTPDEDGFVYGQVDLTIDGETVSELVIEPGEKTYVFTELGNEIDEAGKYQWQLLIDKENNRWANISDYYYPYATISEALIANACDEEGKATLRCIVTSGGQQYVSGEMTVTVAQPTAMLEQLPQSTSTYTKAATTQSAPAGKFARGGVATVADEPTEFQIEVNYRYLHATAVDPTLNNKIAGNTVTITLGTGSSYTGEIASPPVLGYKPFVTVETANALNITFAETEKVEYPKESGNYYVPAPQIEFAAQGTAIAVMVYYIPQKVNFTVRIYEQNLHDDEYTLADTIVVNEDYAVADAGVGEGLDGTRVGFEPLFYDPNTIITGDGTTVVDIYYDRIYYLVNFDLTADAGTGYGVVPMYVRYDTQVTIGTPTNPGYTFQEWELIRVYTVNSDTKVETDIVDGTITGPYDVKNGGSMVTVRHNLKYKSVWQVATTSYTIAYWLQDPDPKIDADGNKTYGYSVWKTVVKTDKAPGAFVTEADIATFQNAAPFGYVGYNNEIYERYYFTYNETQTKNDFSTNKYYTTSGVTVKGDGSTVINIYFDRNDYELRFYYAMSTGSTYYVIGGTTYYFGKLGSNTDDETELIDAYMTTHTGARGQVTALPTYKDDKNLYGSGSVTSSVTSGNYWNSTTTDYTYYYIKFNAKYGANISDLWPVDVFDSVTRTTANTHGQWSSNTAYVSAWNGEHHVYYSQKNDNQTIKGQYQILDYNLLWDYNNFGTSDGVATEESKTVSYMCYWLNGADVNWSIPSLFKYNIHLPGLPGEAEKVEEYNVYDNFNPKDNQNKFSENHIHPSIEGFTKNGDITWEVLAQNQYNTDNFQGAYIIHFYYTRNSNTLTFDDQYTRPPETETVLYGTDLNQYASYVPSYPSVLEENAYTFAGWYIDEECTTAFDFNTTMPDKEVYLYAKWEPTMWNVKVYNDKKIMETDSSNTLSDVTVEFGSMIEEPTSQKPNDSYIFAGWYCVEDGEEKRFDFNTMQVKKDYVIYAKWTSKVPVPYTIYYKAEVDGVWVDIAEPTVGQSLAGISKSFAAKINEQLSAGYRVGYYPTARSTSIMMSAEHPNEFTFVYETLNEVSYTVSHTFVDEKLEKYIGTDTFSFYKEHSISQPNTTSPLISVSFRDMVQEDFVKAAVKDKYTTLTNAELNEIWDDIIVNLSPNAYMQELILVTDSAQNTIRFDWSDRGAEAIYEIVYMTRNLYGDGYSTYLVQQDKGLVGMTYTIDPEDAMEIPGFTLNEGKSKMTGIVSRPLDNGGGLTLTLYYDRLPYTYTVYYYQRGTMEILHGEVTETVPYGTEVTVAAANIPGYHVVSTPSVTVNITNQNQPIIFYYDADDIAYVYGVGEGKGVLSSYGETINITKVPTGSIPQPNSGYIFAGWYKDVYCTVPVTTADATVVTAPGADYGKITPVNPTVAPDQAIYFYAKFVPTKLTIQNANPAANTPAAPEWVDKVDNQDQSYIYLITGKAGTDVAGVSLRVAVAGYSSQTILGLPIGEYTITVEDAWSWRYDDVASVQFASNNAIIDPQGLSEEFTFNGQETMIITYAKPDADTNEGSYYLTDNAYSTQSSTTP